MKKTYFIYFIAYLLESDLSSNKLAINAHILGLKVLTFFFSY